MEPDEDEVLDVGEPMPRLSAVEALDRHRVAVTWGSGGRAGLHDVVDLGPALLRYRVYAPLRDDDAPFRSVRLAPHRFGIAWGDGSIDMGAVTIEDLARLGRGERRDDGVAQADRPRRAGAR